MVAAHAAPKTVPDGVTVTWSGTAFCKQQVPQLAGVILSVLPPPSAPTGEARLASPVTRSGGCAPTCHAVVDWARWRVHTGRGALAAAVGLVVAAWW